MLLFELTTRYVKLNGKWGVCAKLHVASVLVPFFWGFESVVDTNPSPETQDHCDIRITPVCSPHVPAGQYAREDEQG